MARVIQGIICEHDCKVLYNYFLLLWCYSSSLCRDLFNMKYNCKLWSWFSLRQWLAFWESIIFYRYHQKLQWTSFLTARMSCYITSSYDNLCNKLPEQTVSNNRQWAVKLFSFVSKLIKKLLFYDDDEVLINLLRELAALLTRKHCISFGNTSWLSFSYTFTCFVEIIWSLTRIAP